MKVHGGLSDNDSENGAVGKWSASAPFVPPLSDKPLRDNYGACDATCVDFGLCTAYNSGCKGGVLN